MNSQNKNTNARKSPILLLRPLGQNGSGASGHYEIPIEEEMAEELCLNGQVIGSQEYGYDMPLENDGGPEEEDMESQEYGKKRSMGDGRLNCWIT